MGRIRIGRPTPKTGRARLLNCRPTFAGLSVIPTTLFASLTRPPSRGSSDMPANKPVIVLVGGLGAATSWANGSAVYRPISNREVKSRRALVVTLSRSGASPHQRGAPADQN